MARKKGGAAVFVTDMMMNRRPGGNGAVSDQPAGAEQVVSLVRKLEGSEGGWVQLSGAGKFMTIASTAGRFAVTVTVQGKPPKKSGLGRVDLATAVEAARLFAESGSLYEAHKWAAVA